MSWRCHSMGLRSFWTKVWAITSKFHTLWTYPVHNQVDTDLERPMSVPGSSPLLKCFRFFWVTSIHQETWMPISFTSFIPEWGVNLPHRLVFTMICDDILSDVLKWFFQIQESKVTAAQLTSDYKGDDFTGSLTVGNPNILNNSGVFVGHYLQSVTEGLALGGELAYQYGPNVPGGEIAVVTAAARYANGSSTWSGSLGAGGIHVCYYQKCSEQLQIGVEVETSLRMMESTATIGYQVDLPKADLVFRGEQMLFYVRNWPIWLETCQDSS